MTEVEAGSANAEPIKAESSQAVIRGVHGTVKWFSTFNHYGFINRADTGEDIFVHLSGILQKGKIRYGLDEGQEVEFDVSIGGSLGKGDKAVAVTAVGGFAIENTRIVRSNFRRGGPRRIKTEEGEQRNPDDQQVSDENKPEDGKRSKKQRNPDDQQVSDENKPEDGKRSKKQQNPDDQQVSNENKPEGGKRSKKQHGRRRRGSSSNKEDQAGGDAEKVAAQSDKPKKEDLKEDLKEEAALDKPKTEEAKPKVQETKPKVQEAKPKAALDEPKVNQ